MTMLEGGCACGAIRYRLTADPLDAGYCHCEICRRGSGAPVLSFATVPLKDFTFVQGEPARRRSTSFGERSFCRDCGSQLTIHVSFPPGTVAFTIATLDEPKRVPPAFHVFYSRHIAWFDTADDFPRNAEWRPD